MPQYIYKVINTHGKLLRGVTAAANETELNNRLEKTGLTLVHAKEISEKLAALTALASRKVKTHELIHMFIQLQQLLKAGIPLLSALADVRNTTASPRLRDIISEVQHEVSSGTPLSSAMALHSETFAPIFISLVRGAEETGDLINVFAQIIKHLKWIEAMQSKVRKATRYPKILAVVVLGAIWMMMNYVVPQVSEFLQAAGQEMPPVTAALIATSEFIGKYVMYIFIAASLSYILVTLGRSVSRTFRYRTDYIALRSPIIGPVLSKIALSQFSKTFSLLLSSGLEILKCLDVASLTAGNLVLVEALGRARQQVDEGSALSAALENTGEFPSLVIRMLKIGEDTGSIIPLLEQVSEFYDKEVDEAVDAMIQMIEPTLTVVLGGMILWVAAAVFGPVYDSLGALGL